jgi:ribosomal protein S18 acetylase RimI-like enzyme
MLLPNTQIRVATEDELPEVAALQLEVFAPQTSQPALLPFLAEMYLTNQAEVRRGMQARLSGELRQRLARGSTIFVASLGEHAREIIGGVELSSYEMELPTHGLGEGLYVSTLCVDPEYRKRGIGRALMEAVEAEAAGRGVIGIYLHVESCNEAALGLYERAGYTRQAKTPRFETFTRALNLKHREPLLMFKPLV